MRRVLPLIALVLLVGACGSDDDPSISAGRSTSTTSSTTTTSTTALEAAATTTTAATQQEAPGDQAVWPVESSTTRYRDPVEAARGFATGLAGFRQPVVGTFRAGDSRSGEVEVRAAPRGPATTVIVRQLGADGSWWVLASTTPNIELDSPARGATVASPVRVTGRARAFEGTVQVVLREDAGAQPLATGFVTGSGGAELGPFEGELTYTRKPTQARGVLLLFTDSAEDGRVWEVLASRVRF